MRQLFTLIAPLILALLQTANTQAQSAVYPKPGTVFDRKLHSIQLWIHPDSLNQMLLKENWYSDHSYPAMFIYDNEDTLHKVGMRLKGNTSRAAKRKGFRIDFDQFSQQSFQGLKKFNINGNHNDPSMSREYLAAHAMNQAYNPSIRGNLIRLYINGEYLGVRNNSEFIDKTFVQSRFGDNTGNLYKCSWPCDLTWKGANQQTYKAMMNGGERAYDLKTNETADDYTDLVNLINAINNSPTDSFIPRMERMFDVQAYLKTLAMEVLVGHWDNYFANKNNYWLYHNLKTGKFVYLPYDMDNTWGVQWGFSNIANRNIHDWGNKAVSPAPLTYKLFAVPQYKRMYEFYIREHLKDPYHTDSLYKELDYIAALIDTSIQQDPFYNGQRSSDYGFTYNDWKSSYSSAWGNHVSWGIKPFIGTRTTSAKQQMIFASTQSQVTPNPAMGYPNPCENILTIEHNLIATWQGNVRAEAIDLQGRAIPLNYTQIAENQQQLSITTETLNTGLYFIRLSHANSAPIITPWITVIH